MEASFDAQFETLEEICYANAFVALPLEGYPDTGAAAVLICNLALRTTEFYPIEMTCGDLVHFNPSDSSFYIWNPPKTKFFRQGVLIETGLRIERDYPFLNLWRENIQISFPRGFANTICSSHIVFLNRGVIHFMDYAQIHNYLLPIESK